MVLRFPLFYPFIHTCETAALTEDEAAEFTGWEKYKSRANIDMLKPWDNMPAIKNNLIYNEGR